MLDFNNLVDTLGKIKDLKRSGWIKREIKNPESDADHMFSTAFLVLILSDRFEVNKCHCLELALTHDIMEIIAGDAVPGEKTKEDKYNDELKAIKKIAIDLNMPHLVDWFEEFEAGKTPEARLVKTCDKLDAAFMAAYYDKNNRSDIKVFDEFSNRALECLVKMNCNEAKFGSDILRAIKMD